MPLIEHRNAVDLNINAGTMRRAADTGPRHFFALHEFGEGLVEFGKIGRVAQANPHIDDIGEGCTGRRENTLQIPQRLAGLFLNVFGHDRSRRGIERTLS